MYPFHPFNTFLLPYMCKMGQGGTLLRNATLEKKKRRKFVNCIQQMLPPFQKKESNHSLQQDAEIIRLLQNTAMPFPTGAENKLSPTENVDDHNPLKRPLSIDRNPMMMKYGAQEQLAGMALSKRPMTAIGFPHPLALNGGGAAHPTLNVNYAIGLLPTSSAVAQPVSVSTVMANAGSTNGVVSPATVPAVNRLAGSPHGAANLNFSQSFQYQLAAMQAQAKAQQTQPNHAQLLKQMQAAHEHSLAQAQVHAQAEAQVRAHAEVQARVQAHAQAQARAQAQAEAAQVSQAQAQAQALQQAQQQAVALAQQRSFINGGVTTAHEYYYAHAQRAASLPDYLARLASQQQHSHVPAPSSSTAPTRIYSHSANEHFLLHQHHQHQQQLLQQNSALRQQTHQQQLQLAAVAAAAAAATQQQQQQQQPQRRTSPIVIPSAPRIPTMSASVMTSHSGMHAPTSTPSTSVTSGPTPIVRMRAPMASAMGPHDDRRYHEFLIGVMQLERQITESLMASTNAAEQAAVAASKVHSLTLPHMQTSGLLEKQVIE